MRLSHLSAVAVMIALVGAMFVALQSVSAAACAVNPDITLGFGETCTITLTDIDEAATGASITVPDAAEGGATGTDVDDQTTAGVAEIEAGTVAGTATVSVTKDDGDDEDDDPDVVETFTVNVVGFAITKVAVQGDSDNVVKAGPQIVVEATVRSAASTTTQVRLTVPTTGLSIQVDDDGSTSQSQTKPVTADRPSTVPFTVNTAGAPAGVYELTFTADDNSFGTPNTEGQTANSVKSLEVRIGDPGTGLASATLSLGNSSEDLPYTEDDESEAETGTAPAATGDGINLVIEVLDSLGGKANAGAIDQIIVIAPGGDVSVPGKTTGMHGVTSNQSGATIREYDEDEDSANADTMDNVGQRTVINVKKDGGTSAKPGMVTVYAIVSGSGGAATTESLTLSFSGATDSIEVADATDTLRSVNVDADEDGTIDDDERDTVKLAVTGTDSGGIANDPGSGFSITITDSDGKRVNSDKMAASLGDYAGGKRDVTVTGKGATGAALKAGEYTVKLKKGDLEDTGMFSVAGSAANVTVTASAMSSDSIGDVITVTATVTDADGNAVSGGTSVMFDVSEDTGLAAIGTGHAGKGTKDGAASVRYAVVGAGHSVISATADDATGVIVIDSTAGMVEPEAMPEEEAGLSCLSSLSGFSTWTCDVEASASEIFDWISSRGATALHLNSNRMWVRYSVVDGAMVPGSSDFMVTKSDILYISN